MENTGFYTLTVKQQEQCMHALAEAALQQWSGAFTNLSLVKYRENAVFSAYRNDGQRVALRVHRYGYHSDSELAAELCWMRAISSERLRVPGVILPKSGEPFAVVTHAAVPEPRQVDMLTWLEGEPIGAIEGGSGRDEPELVDTYYHLGRVAADLHIGAMQWSKPRGFTRHSWDCDGLLGDAPFWGAFWELEALSAEQRALLLAARDKASVDLTGLGKGQDIYGLIHADMVPENVLVAPDGLALIDFDDAGFGWFMFELVTALYFNLDHPAYTKIEAALFEGYASLRPNIMNRDQLPLFLLLRSLTYLGWLHTRREMKEIGEMTPMFVERSCALAAAYLEGRILTISA